MLTPRQGKSAQHAANLPRHARRSPKAGVGHQLAQHEVCNVGTGDTHRQEKAPDMTAMTKPAPLVAVGQHPRPHDHPLHVTLRDHPFLPRLVPEVEGQNHWNHKERERGSLAADIPTASPGYMSNK